MIVVYTALFGDHDRLWSVPPVVLSGARYVVFTEKPRRECGLWMENDRIKMMEGTGDLTPPVPTWEQQIVETSLSPRRSARYYKALAHEVLPEASISIWVDANVRMLITPEEAVDRWFQQEDLMTFKHPVRTCYFREAAACKRLGKGDPEKIDAQVKAYQRAKMPMGYGLPSTKCVIRRHTPWIARLNIRWWEEIERYSERDQLSLPFVCWELGFKWKIIPGYVLQNNAPFWFIKHGEVPK